MTIRPRTETSRIKLRLAFVVATVLLDVSSSGCGASDGNPAAPGNPAVKAVATVTVSPATLSLTVGSTGLLTATTLDANGRSLAGRTISWSSSDPALASVAADGKVTGIAAGGATITATSEGKTATAATTVVPPGNFTLRVSPATATITAGASATIPINIDRTAGNTSAVTLVATGLPIGVSLGVAGATTGTSTALTLTATP